MENVQGHVAVRHVVNGEWGKQDVNSFHNQACRELKDPLLAMAVAGDGVIEAASYPEKNIITTMWHPEREIPFQTADVERVRKLFG